MITKFPFEACGKADYGWLKASYHFSFGEYANPDKHPIGPLCVWNDDVIAAGTGFPMHPHKNMEIITYVRSGAITHEDSLGNKGRTEAGNIQLMSAGHGIRHSEFNHEASATTLFQIWIEPKQLNIKPYWDSIDLKNYHTPGWTCLVSGNKNDGAPLTINQNIRLWRFLSQKKDVYQTPESLGNLSYGVISKGQIKLNNKHLFTQDGIKIQDETTLIFEATEETEWMVLEIFENIKIYVRIYIYVFSRGFSHFNFNTNNPITLVLGIRWRSIFTRCSSYGYRKVKKTYTLKIRLVVAFITTIPIVLIQVSILLILLNKLSIFNTYHVFYLKVLGNLCIFRALFGWLFFNTIFDAPRFNQNNKLIFSPIFFMLGILLLTIGLLK